MALSVGMANAAEPAPQTWTGFYIGANFGGAWENSRWTRCNSVICGAEGVNFAPGADDGSQVLGGVLGGGQVGFNFQFAQRWVAGIEANFDAANLTGSSFPCFANTLADTDTHNTCSSKSNFLGTISGRVGQTFGNTWLYVLGGGTWIHNSHVDDYFWFASNQPVDHFTASETRWGWTAGIGGEYAIDDHWSARLQYNYMNYDTRTVNFNSPTITVPGNIGSRTGFFSENIQPSVHVVTIGINYRFGSALFGR
jgi:outer membrane immunogenic protein